MKPEIKTIEAPFCSLCGSIMETKYSTRSLSNYYICTNKKCKYSDKLGVYEDKVEFKNKKYISLDSLKEILNKFWNINEEKLIKKYGYDENINLSPLAKNIGFAFNDNLQKMVKEIKQQIKSTCESFLESGKNEIRN